MGPGRHAGRVRHRRRPGPPNRTRRGRAGVAASPPGRLPASGPGGSPGARPDARATRRPARGAGSLPMAVLAAQAFWAAAIRRIQLSLATISRDRPTRKVPMIPQIRPALALPQQPGLTVAGVDLGDHAVAHDPRERRDQLAEHQPEDPENQHRGRLRVLRRRRTRRAGGRTGSADSCRTAAGWVAAAAAAASRRHPATTMTRAL